MCSRDWVRVFQWFHENPELSFQEKETTKKIREILTSEGVEIVPTNLSTGLIAVIRGDFDGKSVCLRADIDALPIQEQTDLVYASKRKDVMHACGHNFHITAALAVAAQLNRLKDQMHGAVYIAFQPGEEVFTGAEKIWKTGVLQNVSEFYGFHADPAMKVGEVGIKEAGIMAAGDRFRIHVRGIGTHGATPHLGNNPIPILVSLISAIQDFAARELSPIQPHILSFTHIEGGNTWNIIPETAFCEGTVRTLDHQAREFIRDSFFRIVQSFGEMMGVVCELEWISGPAAVINSAVLCQAARTAASETGVKAVNFIPEMISDDFSFYTEHTPDAQGLYLKIGTGIGYPLHHPKFRVDPNVIAPTAEFISKLLLNSLS